MIYNKDWFIAKDICSILRSDIHSAVFAGGYVRDSCCNKQYSDIDIATSQKPENVAILLSKYVDKIKEVGKSFGVVLVEKDGCEFEIATYRKDVKCDGRKPSSVEFSSMEEDAKRRDFTMNAVFYDPEKGEYYDFVDGLNDIRNNIVRFVGDSVERIKEDYLRYLRYMRFIAQGFKPVEEQYKEVRNFRLQENFIKNVAGERIQKELVEKVFTKHIASKFFLTLKDFSNIFEDIFGRVSYIDFTLLEYLDSINANYQLYLASIYYYSPHAIPCLQLQKLGFSNYDINYVEGILNNFRALTSTTTLDLLRKIKAKDYFDDLVIFSKRVLYTNELKSNLLQLSLYDKKLPKPKITGDDLIIMGLKPSEIFSDILKNMYSIQLCNDSASREKLLQLTKEFME